MPHIVRGIALAAALAGAASVMPAATVPQHALAHSDGHGAAHGGQGEGRGFAAGEPGDPKRPHRMVEIVMSEGPGTMTYSPDRIEVRKGDQVQFVLKNAGELAHEFVLDTVENNARHRTAMEHSPEMAHQDPNAKRLDPKRSAEILWRFTRAGTFEFACLIPGHYETGMKGVVVVK
jgi:uncharacterized cupredoxin-like copper-binding protein